jgi:hypothetical protein
VGIITLHRKKMWYEKSNRASDLDVIFGLKTQTMEYGYEIRMELGEVGWGDVD